MQSLELDRSAVRIGAAPSNAAEPADRILSFGQQRLWFHERLGSAGKAYHIARWMHLQGALDRGAVRQTLDRIVARHETLRTTFHAVGGEAVQRIAPAAHSRAHLFEHDLTAHPDAEAERERIMAEAVAEAFDLEQGPLVRWHLIRLRGDRCT